MKLRYDPTLDMYVDDVDDASDSTPVDDGTLGSCGCVDYHYADCPIRTSHYSPDELDDWYESDKWIRDEEYDRGEHE